MSGSANHTIKKNGKVDDLFSFEIVETDKGRKVVVCLVPMSIRLEFDVPQFHAFVERLLVVREKLKAPTDRRYH